MNFFDLQFTGGFCSFLTPSIFYPPEGVPNAVVPLWGPIWVSFYFISSLGELFWGSIYWRYLLIFDARDFLYWRMGDGWMGDGRMGGQAKSKKIMYFQHFSKTIRYFFLVVSPPPRRLSNTFSKKKSKKLKNFKFFKKFRTIFFFSDFFDFLSKKVNFSKTFKYFLLVVSWPPRRVLKTFSEKNSKKLKIF